MEGHGDADLDEETELICCRKSKGEGEDREGWSKRRDELMGVGYLPMQIQQK